MRNTLFSGKILSFNSQGMQMDQSKIYLLMKRDIKKYQFINCNQAKRWLKEEFDQMIFQSIQLLTQIQSLLMQEKEKIIRKENLKQT